MFPRLAIIAASLLGLWVCSAAQPISLAGQWQFALDASDAGIRERWFTRDLTDRIELPGVLQAQGYGNEIGIDTPWVLSLYDRLWFLRADYAAYTNAGSVKVPFLCQPPRHYLGPAWYQKEFEVPTAWEGKRITLALERTRWETRVWHQDRIVGTDNSLCAPHEFDLGVLAPGKHRLTIRVDNRMLLPYRPDAHAVSDSLGSTWNGIAGRIELSARDAVSIKRLRLDPDLDRKGVGVTLAVRNETGQSADARLLSVQVTPANFDGNAFPLMNHPGPIPPGDSEIKLFYPLTDGFERWSEFNPRLYRVRVQIAGNGFRSEAVDRFGMRDFRAEGTALVINGVQTHLRGTHHGGDFPLTGYPPTDVEYWRRLWIQCREWGMNHVRFHSFCPPKAAFEAADEVGMYLQPEPGMWNTFNPDSPVERMLYTETERMLAAYGNHPSFVLFSPSNEPKGRWRDVLPKWAAHFRNVDPRRLYTSGTGFTDSDAPGPMDQLDFVPTQRFGPRRVRGEPGWFGNDYSASLRDVSIPVLAHENGQWCAYPDYGIIAKFTGYMRPGNYEIFRDSMAMNGLLHKNADFARASGRFQLACYKEEIEANLRTPGLAGFQLLDLHEYTGQGTALVGLLDPFWEPKSYVDATEFRRFCSATVPLARLRQRIFRPADRFHAAVEVAHYGNVPLTNAELFWRITDRAGATMLSGVFPRTTVPIGRAPAPGQIEADLSTLPAPGQYNLVVGIRETNVENDWTFWLYPAQVEEVPAPNVLVTDSWTEAGRRLAAGGKVLFLPRNVDLGWNSPPLAEVPVFWNRLMNPGWSRMLGIWCDTNHPALAQFPTDANCDWQWTEIVRGVRPMNLASFPRELDPIVQVIDDWNRNWKLGAIFECAVGSGRLMVCSFDLTTDLERRPVARQLRHSLLSYMSGNRFQPRTRVTPAEVAGALFDTRIMSRLDASVSGGGERTASAIDGDPNTAWTAGGSGRDASGTRHPHALTIRFPAPVAMTGLVLVNRQNDRDHLGDIREYRIELSDDSGPWREIKQGTLASTWAPQTVDFGQAVRATAIRFTALSGFGSDTTVALAELAIQYAGPPLSEDAAGSIEYRRARSTSTDVDENP